MSCNYPITAYRLSSGAIVFDTKYGYDIITYLKVPCGVCIGCRMERARQWAVRCMHESSLYDENCFITLTYNDDHLPEFDNLNYDDFQRFMKRLRKKYTGKKIRFFMSGEYGESFGRPHFHACLFGHSFDDRLYLKTSPAGAKIYTSESLQSLWLDRNHDSIGFSTVGDINYNSAAYVARYILKKKLGRGSEDFYETMDLETGEVVTKNKEFNKMSLKPGIGTGFYKKFKSDMFPQDVCVVNGKATKPPKFYFKKLAEDDGTMYDDICYTREMRAMEKAEDNIPERLEVKEKCLEAKIKLLKRELI
jgi:hypothetical protein